MGEQGRPTKYKSEYDVMATNYCLLGATNEELAKFFEVDLTTINYWMHNYPSFSHAIKEGREIADANVAKSLYKRAIGYSHNAVKIFCDPKTGAVEEVPYVEHYPPDTTAANSWLNNRRRQNWKQRNDVELSGDKENPVRVDLQSFFKVETI